MIDLSAFLRGIGQLVDLAVMGALILPCLLVSTEEKHTRMISSTSASDEKVNRSLCRWRTTVHASSTFHIVSAEGILDLPLNSSRLGPSKVSALISSARHDGR